MFVLQESGWPDRGPVCVSGKNRIGFKLLQKGVSISIEKKKEWEKFKGKIACQKAQVKRIGGTETRKNRHHPAVQMGPLSLRSGKGGAKRQEEKPGGFPSKEKRSKRKFLWDSRTITGGSESSNSESERKSRSFGTKRENASHQKREGESKRALSQKKKGG